MDLSRRDAMRGIGGFAAYGALAGCLGEPAASGEDAPDGYAALFTLEDWTHRIAGEGYSFESPMEAGEVGHGWSPQFDLQARIAETDAFVYLDLAEFRWAQDVATELEAEADVALIDGVAGLEGALLPWDGRNGHADGGEHDDHDHDPDSVDDDHGDDGDHDHGEYDPHVWLDPVLARDVVDTITTGLAAVYPEDADSFEANAEAYKSELERVHERFEQLVADATLDTAVLAGHDSFQYLERRYGFDVHTPIGVSPDENVREGQVAETIAFVDEHGVDTILYDAFDAPEGEAPPLARTIVEESSATDAAAVSPAAGTFQRWLDEGWGWVEQMEELNLPAFRRALRAE